MKLFESCCKRSLYPVQIIGLGAESHIQGSQEVLSVFMGSEDNKKKTEKYQPHLLGQKTTKEENISTLL